MGDHFVLLVDRLLTESTLEAAIESRNPSKQSTASVMDEMIIDCDSQGIDSANDLTPRKIVECRICHDEDQDSNMETPCSCCGSLKYAHRRCVQRWCNEKGDTVCEICHQQYKPGYTAPPPMFQYGGIPLNFRGNWEIDRSDPNNPRIIAMVSADRNFLDPEYDEYEASTTRSLMCCRSVAIIVHSLSLSQVYGSSDFTAYTSPYSQRSRRVLFPIDLVVSFANFWDHCTNLHYDEGSEYHPASQTPSGVS
ncbi:uncharacterized protein LOC132295380 isoform X2 [Cornus florida]|uniref:uncharacterized protein LOC132295380 isoform X2 n=1 Tax=Cornus florida TaxID=4283 RepID=UPI00289AEC6D|nr:uncharacterized protein LOC132295380 isoform X2 [Cornus florida]